MLDTCAFPDTCRVCDVGAIGRAAYREWDASRSIQHGVQIGGFYAGVFRFGHGAGEVSLHLDDFELSGVSLAVEPGCVVGFIGSNGAGKTTTIKAILGIIAADAVTSPAMMAALI